MDINYHPRSQIKVEFNKTLSPKNIRIKIDVHTFVYTIVVNT